jgi:two-component system phosphate regulon sensor histidine kinase PhoR
MKRMTPRRIALLAAGALILLLLIGLGLLMVFGLARAYWTYGLGLSLLIGLAAYGIFLEAIRRFLQEKLKLIHRTVQGLRSRNDARSGIDLDEDVLGELQEELAERAEKEREEVRRLKEQEAFRRRFVGNVAHELKTPIFSIQGHILTLLEGALEDPEINRKFLERASKSVDRMTRIIEDLDTITQFESGRLEVEKDVHDPKEAASDVMATLEIKAEKKGVSLGFREGGGDPPQVLMDRQRIEQVLSNLISNAIAHSERGGKVEVAFSDLEEHVLVEVIDEGVGIAEKDIPRIFERFYRVDKSRSREYGGTGLGLSIVKHILEAHGQSIDVRSQEDEGSIFSFTLEKA